MDMSKQATISGTIYMPSENGGTQPAPFLLTKDEAARFLRIEGEATDNTFRRYHELGLRPVRIGMSNKYALADLIAFVENKRG